MTFRSLSFVASAALLSVLALPLVACSGGSDGDPSEEEETVDDALTVSGPVDTSFARGKLASKGRLFVAADQSLASAHFEGEQLVVERRTKNGTLRAAFGQRGRVVADLRTFAVNSASFPQPGPDPIEGRLCTVLVAPSGVVVTIGIATQRATSAGRTTSYDAAFVHLASPDGKTTTTFTDGAFEPTMASASCSDALLQPDGRLLTSFGSGRSHVVTLPLDPSLTPPQLRSAADTSSRPSWPVGSFMIPDGRVITPPDSGADVGVVIHSPDRRSSLSWPDHYGRGIGVEMHLGADGNMRCRTGTKLEVHEVEGKLVGSPVDVASLLGPQESVSQFAVDGSGRYWLTLGTAVTPTSPINLSLTILRVLANGQVDTTFGNGGRLTVTRAAPPAPREIVEPLVGQGSRVLLGSRASAASDFTFVRLQ